MSTITQILLYSYEALVLILASWRLSNLVSNENGPFHIFRRLRRWAASTCRRYKWCRRFGLYELVNCEYCNSVWICTALWLLWLAFGIDTALFFTPLAMSTAVIMLKRAHEHLQR